MANPAIIVPSTAIQGAPFGVDRLVAEGTRYLTDSATAIGTVSTELLDKELFRNILDTEPTPYTTLLTLLFSMTPEPVSDLEFVAHESGVSFGPLVVDAIAAEVPAVAGTAVTQTVNLDAASMSRVGLNMIVGYNTGSYKGTIVAINTGATTITVKSMTSDPLPALAVGDQLTTGHGEIVFDGQSGANYFRRPTTVARYNYLQEIRVLESWNRNEADVWRMKGRTDYLAFKEMRLKRDFQEMLAINFVNGRRGQYHSTVTGQVTRGMHGMWPWMQEYGAAYAPIPVASFKAVFETLFHNTNYTGNVVYAIGHQECLQIFSDTYKTQLTRYQPTDMVANLDLDAVMLGGRRVVMVPMNALREPGMFEKSMGNKIFFVDKSAMKPVKFGARDLIERIGPTQTVKEGDSNLSTFRRMGYEGMISFKMNLTEAAFTIELTDL